MNSYAPESYGFAVLALPPTCVPPQDQALEGVRTRTVSVCTGFAPPMTFTVTEYPSCRTNKETK